MKKYDQSRRNNDAPCPLPVRVKSKSVRPALGLCLVTLSVWLVLSCCGSHYTGVLLPIREASLRMEKSLPLDSSDVNELTGFIAAGGIKSSSHIVSIADTRQYREFLALFRPGADSMLKAAVFERQTALKKYIDPLKYERDIVNSCDSLEPEAGTRRAYLFNDFWFVFLVDNTIDPATGTTILDAERRFSRIIVMKQWSHTGESRERK